MRTELAGDIVFGPKNDQGPDAEDVVNRMDYLFHFTPQFLVYTVKDAPGNVAFGAVGEPTDPDRIYSQPYYLNSVHDPGFGLTSPLFTEVQPEDVVRVDVFTSTDHGGCEGILLEYKNGGQRALGPCRLGGVDHVTTFHNPVMMCFMKTEGPFDYKRIEFSVDGAEHDRDHDPKDWTCARLYDGHLECAWNNTNTVMNLVQYT